MSPATGGVHPARRTDALTLRCPPCLPPRVQDSFETGSKLAMASGATSNYIPDSRGVQAAWSDLSGSTKRARSSLRAGHALSAAEKSDYLKGFNSAEKDFRERGSVKNGSGQSGATKTVCASGVCVTSMEGRRKLGSGDRKRSERRAA